MNTQFETIAQFDTVEGWLLLLSKSKELSLQLTAPCGQTSNVGLTEGQAIALREQLAKWFPTEEEKKAALERPNFAQCLEMLRMKFDPEVQRHGRDQLLKMLREIA